MAVWSGNRLAHTDPWGAIVASYSSDEGVTWTEPTVIFDSPLDDRDPNLYIEGDTIFIGYFTQWDIYRPDNGYHTAEECAQWSKYYYWVTAEDVEKYGSSEVNGISNNYIISRDGGQTFEYGGKISSDTPKGVSEQKILYGCRRGVSCWSSGGGARCNRNDLQLLCRSIYPCAQAVSSRQKQGSS